MFSPFWNGFAVGAVLFAIIGAAVGIFTIALCQAAAKGNGTCERREREVRSRGPDLPA